MDGLIFMAFRTFAMKRILFCDALTFDFREAKTENETGFKDSVPILTIICEKHYLSIIRDVAQLVEYSSGGHAMGVEVQVLSSRLHLLLFSSIYSLNSIQ